MRNKNKQPIINQLTGKSQMILVFLFVLTGLVLSIHSPVQALPGRVSYVQLTCSNYGTAGALSKTGTYWTGYPSNTTGQANDFIFKYEGGSWVLKGAAYDEGGPSSSGTAEAIRGNYSGAAYYQVQGRTWLNHTWPIDNSRTSWCG